MIDIGKLTTFQTKNLAKNFFQINNNDDLYYFLDHYTDEEDIFCFWWWSNVLFSKQNYEKKIFVKNNLQWIKYLWMDYFEVNAGELLLNFVKFILQEHSINMLNPIFAIPWTIWGAVIWNAGSYWVEIWRFVKKIKYVDESGEIVENDNYIHSYRHSNLSNKKILLISAVLHFPIKNNPDLKDMKEYLEMSLKSKEYYKTCGCYFKNHILTDKDKQESILAFKENPIKDQYYKEQITIPAGWMIDKVWLRGYEENWVKISEKHANFIVNYNNENPENILKMAKLIKQKVFEKFGIILKEEVKII